MILKKGWYLVLGTDRSIHAGPFRLKKEAIRHKRRDAHDESLSFMQVVDENFAWGE